jgi:hypothetical protein
MVVTLLLLPKESFFEMLPKDAEEDTLQTVG